MDPKQYAEQLRERRERQQPQREEHEDFNLAIPGFSILPMNSAALRILGVDIHNEAISTFEKVAVNLAFQKPSNHVNPRKLGYLLQKLVNEPGEIFPVHWALLGPRGIRVIVTSNRVWHFFPPETVAQLHRDFPLDGSFDAASDTHRLFGVGANWGVLHIPTSNGVGSVKYLFALSQALQSTFSGNPARNNIFPTDPRWTRAQSSQPRPSVELPLKTSDS